MKIKSVWYSDKVSLDSPDAVHQILMYGDLKEIQALKQQLGADKVKELFLGYPKKIYSPSSLNFIKNFILGINISIDEQKYLKSTPRNIR